MQTLLLKKQHGYIGIQSVHVQHTPIRISELRVILIEMLAPGSTLRTKTTRTKSSSTTRRSKGPEQQNMGAVDPVQAETTVEVIEEVKLTPNPPPKNDKTPVHGTDSHKEGRKPTRTLKTPGNGQEEKDKESSKVPKDGQPPSHRGTDHSPPESP